jgi:hypothetical protein
MVANDIVTVEFPASAADGIELITNLDATDPSGYACQKYAGTWTNATNPFAMIICGKM